MRPSLILFWVKPGEVRGIRLQMCCKNTVTAQGGDSDNMDWREGKLIIIIKEKWKNIWKKWNFHLPSNEFPSSIFLSESLRIFFNESLMCTFLAYFFKVWDHQREILMKKIANIRLQFCASKTVYIIVIWNVLFQSCSCFSTLKKNSHSRPGSAFLWVMVDVSSRESGILSGTEQIEP